MWNKFSDKKPEENQICILEDESEWPTICVYSCYVDEADIIVYGWFNDLGDIWSCGPEDYWIPCPRFPKRS